MKKLVIVIVLAMQTVIAFCQHQVTFSVKDSLTMEPLLGATILLKGTGNGAVADIQGKVTIQNVPPGMQTFLVRMTGYLPKEIVLTVPAAQKEVSVLLTVSSDELDEIIVEGTRSNRTIDNIPTRVEVLTEEIDEASTMDPSKVAHLLTHSTGIQVQQTSATSNTANVRIQGMDGRYTQTLRDGFPLYGGFSGSLSIMQIPPLDLRQVEYVKGSSSTLYGAGAISGLINLISKEPKLGRDETILHVNASHVGAFDVNAFTSSRRGKIGYTLLAQRNTHRFFDADDDGFTDLPQLTKYNFNPKLFFYFNEKNKLYVGTTITNEIRQGGDTKLFGFSVPDSLHFYKETNDVSRITTQVKFDHQFGANLTLTARNSFNIFNRVMRITPSPLVGVYQFGGEQISSFSEIAVSFKKSANVLIAGLNYYTDYFTEEIVQGSLKRDEGLQTVGAFINYTFDVNSKMAIESGLRGDYTMEMDFHLLPRVSMLFKWTEKLTTRIGGGMGYRNPSIFNQEAEVLGYRNVLPIDYKKTESEKSYGANADIGYKTTFGENFFININQMFFFTHLNNPLVLSDTSGNSGVYQFVNANGYTESYGAETFFKFGFYDFVFFAGYTYTHVTHHFGDSTVLATLTPQHSLKGDLLYALPGKWRIGADYEYKSSQLLSNGISRPEFWTYGVVVEYTWTNYTLFCNVENFTNVRQTQYKNMASAPYNTPQFTEVWAPLDGIVLNVGFKIRL